MTTPKDQATAKVKEILIAYSLFVDNLRVGRHSNVPDTWLTTPAAQTLIDSLAGEDWISVKDKEPPVKIDDHGQRTYSETVLFTDGKKCFCGWLEKMIDGDFFWIETTDSGEIIIPKAPDKKDDDFEYTIAKITHWQPLPEPPAPC